MCACPTGDGCPLPSSPCLQGEAGRGWLLIFGEERPLPNPPLQAGEGAECTALTAKGSANYLNVYGYDARLI